MKAKRGFICILMTLLIVTGFLFAAKSNVMAGEGLPSFKFEGGIASWEFVTEANKYSIYVESSLGYTIIDTSEPYDHNGCLTYTSTGIIFNMQRYLDVCGKYKDGSYKVSIEAMKDKESLSYCSVFKFDYVCSLPQLKSPSNLKWDGTVISWDAVPECDYYHVDVLEVKDGKESLVWTEESTSQTSFDTTKDSHYSPSYKGVKYDEDSSYYFWVRACDNFLGREHIDSERVFSETISGRYPACDTGVTGECEWAYNPAKHKLTIFGKGAMADYATPSVYSFPWSTHFNDITNVVIEDGVTHIGNYAFSGMAIKSISIPDSVVTIGKRAFYNCSSLEKITFGSGLKTIGDYAFVCSASSNPKLKKVTLPSNIIDFGEYCIGFVQSSGEYTSISGFEITGECCSNANVYARDNSISWKSLGHVWNDGVISKKASCKEDGEKVLTCYGCGETKSEKITAGHYDLPKTEAKPATVAAEGNKEYYVCPDCGKWFEDQAGTKEITDHSSVIIPRLTPTATPTVAATPTVTAAPTAAATAAPASTGTAAPTASVTPAPGSEDIAVSPSDDGTVLTDADGSKYYVADKVTASQLSKKLAVADKVTGGKYKITGLTRKGKKITGGTVSFIKPYDSSAAIVKVADTVKIAGLKFKVTEIAKNACKGNSSIKKVTIGKNVAKIGANAFNGCTNLKSIKIKTVKLTKKTVGKNAFKNINKNAVAGVPKGKRKTYKAVLKAKGMNAKTQKIK